ncbi:polysaccharide deacetylase family protein [Actinoallomurus spadix]|uniref:Polysaccharide deacetylase family protein n=1 Tax=Actinoallomurus spadix TaxID=79912 RepID=A0ABN0XKE3_9ACTN|nr:polysaccharide deacetylase family protein [Actinoallomurus spadix]MCO5985021.1 polysaccharide deacetylase family protein [Actinoallomurus spadix]
MGDAPTAPVPILMYHSIGGPDRLAVRPEAFAEQLALLRDCGFTPITFGELAAGDPVKGRPVVITFDDGYADFHERALPLLDRFGFRATVFVTTGWIRDAGPYAAGRPLGPTLSWSQVAEIAACGIEVGGHGHSHAQLDQLRDAVLRTELLRSRRLLEDRVGRPVTTMAYPYGYSSARVRRETRAAGYDAACAVANTLAAGDGDRLAVPRVTVRAGTSLAAFERALRGRGFLLDHALTKGYAVVRRSRYAVRRLRGTV